MNHYELAINDIIEHVKADKGIVQPWRNKAIARMEEAQAFIRMGLTTTYQQPPQGATVSQTFTCICPTGGIRRDCPMHGEEA